MKEWDGNPEDSRPVGETWNPAAARLYYLCEQCGTHSTQYSEVEETHEEIVGSPGNPKVEGYVHISQQTKNVNLGTEPGLEKGFSFLNQCAKKTLLINYIFLKNFLALMIFL